MGTIDDVSLKSLTVLAAVARAGGFSAAGRQLGLRRAAVSRIVAQLESQLGVRLFRRTTRRVVLTEAAERLVAELRHSLPAVRSAIELAAAGERQLSGLVRVSVSHAFGRRYALPSIARFVAAHPSVQVDLQLSDLVDDLVGQTLDVAVRMGSLPPKSMIARRVGRLEVVLVAAPQLLERYLRPGSPADLVRFPMVGFRVPGTQELYPWPLEDRGRGLPQPRLVPVRADSIEGVVDLARLGCGAAFVPRYLVEDDLEAGRLIPLLEEAMAPGPEVHVCFLDRELMPPRVRAVIAHLESDLEHALRAP